MKQIRYIIILFIVLFLSFTNISRGEKPSVTGILGALDEEIELLETKITGGNEVLIEGIWFKTGEISGRQVVLSRTGVGKVNAAIVTTLLIEHYYPDEVIFTGIAGGINPDLLPGDIVIAARTAQHDFGTLTPDGLLNRGARNPINGIRNPVYFTADPRLLALAEISAGQIILDKISYGETARIPKIITGIVVSGDIFVSSPAKRLELRQLLEADAVEMEGAAVAQVCWQQDVSCLVIRSLSDRADESAEQDFEVYRYIAAHNSAVLVLDIISQLASQGTQEK